MSDADSQGNLIMVDFKRARDASPEVRASIIKSLEEFLADAKSGKLRSFVAAAVVTEDDGGSSVVSAYGGCENRLETLGMLEVLRDYVKRSI